jgi:hypothetical protein
VTDEAGAIEGLGLKPRLVMGDSRNIKVTFPEDLAIAELILRGRDGKTAKMRTDSKSKKRTARNARKSKIRTRARR